MDSLTSPRIKAGEEKSEVEIFYNLSVDEQKEFLKQLLAYRDTMFSHFPEFQMPPRLVSSSSSSMHLYLHLVEFKLSSPKFHSEITSGIYLKITMGKKTKKSKVLKEISSVFNETFLFKKVKKKGTLQIEVFSGMHHLLGEVKILIHTMEETDVIQRWFPVSEKRLHGPPGGIIGSLSLRYCYTDEKIGDMAIMEDTFKVFGSSLAEIERRDRQIIPAFLIQMTDYLREHALHEEGLFRVSGLTTAVHELKTRINTGNTKSVDFSNYPIPVISTLYKNFFDSLPEPLIPYSLSHFFLECSENFEDLKRVVNKLPRRNKAVLGYLIQFLQEVAQQEEYNKMSISNLSIIFQPILFRLTETSVEQTISQGEKGRNCLCTLISSHDTLFNISSPLLSPHGSVGHPRHGSNFVDLSSTSPANLDFNEFSVLKRAKSKSNNLTFTTVLKSPRSSTKFYPKLNRSLSDNDLTDPSVKFVDEPPPSNAPRLSSPSVCSRTYSTNEEESHNKYNDKSKDKFEFKKLRKTSLDFTYHSLISRKVKDIRL